MGRTEQQARDAGLDVKTVSYGIGSVAGRALLGKDVAGKAQLVIDQAQRVVVPNVAEMPHAATIRSSGECRSTRCGTRSRRSPPSARCGCACSRPTAGSDGAGHPDCSRRCDHAWRNDAAISAVCRASSASCSSRIRPASAAAPNLRPRK